MKTVKKVSAYLFLLTVFNVAYGAEADEILDSTIKETILSFAHEGEPVFYRDTLYVPSVSSSGKPGLYQDAVFNLQEDGSWLLENAVVGRLVPSDRMQVELLQTDGFPKQAFLKIRTYDTSGCDELSTIGRINIQETDNVFNIFVYSGSCNFPILEGVSYMPLTSTTVQIPIFGLPAGDYSYVVNDEFTGTFSLESNNYYDFSGEEIPSYPSYPVIGID